MNIHQKNIETLGCLRAGLSCLTGITPLTPGGYHSYFPPTDGSLSRGYGAEPRAPQVLSLLSHYVRLLRTIKIWILVERDLNEFLCYTHKNTLM